MIDCKRYIPILMNPPKSAPMNKLPYLTVLGEDTSLKLKEIMDRYPNMSASEIIRRCVVYRWRVMKENDKKEKSYRKERG